MDFGCSLTENTLSLKENFLSRISIVSSILPLLHFPSLLSLWGEWKEFHRMKCVYTKIYDLSNSGHTTRSVTFFSLSRSHTRFFSWDDKASNKIGVVLHRIYPELLTFWAWCLEHFTCSFALKIQGYTSENHTLRRTRFSCLLEQGLRPFTAQTWGHMLSLSLTFSSSPQSLPSGPKNTHKKHICI